MSNVLDNKRQAWGCKIGCMGGVEIPQGADAPMREAVRSAFIEITGQEPEAIFSGWGAEFTPQEQAVIRNDGSWPDPVRGEAVAPATEEYVPKYKTVTDHNGRVTGVEWTNADKRPPVAAAKTEAVAPVVQDWKHVANEWADTASSALVWLMNVRDGISEVQDAIDNVQVSMADCRALELAQSVTPVAVANAPVAGEGLTEAVRDKLRDALSAELGGAMDCKRVWKAWQDGTMTEHDFHLLTDNNERLDDLVGAVETALATQAERQPQAAGQEGQRVWIAYNSADDDEAVMFYTEKPSDELKARFVLKEYVCYAAIQQSQQAGKEAAQPAQQGERSDG